MSKCSKCSKCGKKIDYIYLVMTSPEMLCEDCYKETTSIKVI